MRKTMLFQSLIVVLMSGLAVLAQGPATGVPAFSSTGGGPFDVINLGNGNVHFTIPVLHKAGRGRAFTYDLTYDSSIWVPVSSGSNKTWSPVSNWGWTANTQSNLGYLIANYYTLYYTCNLPGGGIGNPYTGTWMTDPTYVDQFGISHPFGMGLVMYNTNGEPCLAVPPGNTSQTSTTYDGTGLKLSMSWGNSTGTVTTISGDIRTVGVGVGPGRVQDANGNLMTSNSSGQFFDTLSSTAPVLTVSGTAPNPTKFTYTPPSLTNVSYTMNYKAYTVATNFAAGVIEYGAKVAYLVDTIQLPGGTQYSFTYEATPSVPASGACTPKSGTTSCVTGRIISVTLPAGGSITYSYSQGGTGVNGIYSDGTVPTLTRALSPGGTWTYARSNVSGSHWQTTINDPSSNQTVIDFQKGGPSPSLNFFETQRQMYQGSISSNSCSSTVTTNCLLATTITCYNTNYINCSTTGVNAIIAQTDTYNLLLNGKASLVEVKYTSGLVTDRREYDYGVVLNAAPGTTKLIRETGIQYASLGNGIQNRPATITIADWTSGTSKTLASTTYTYDGTTPTPPTGTTPQHNPVTGSRGNLTTIATQANGTNTLYRQFTYYDTGMPKTSTDVDTSSATTCSSKPSICTTYNYSSVAASCGNAFPTSVSEPLSLSRSTVWNCVGGVATQVTDENLQVVKSDYADTNFWRPDHVYDQESNDTKISYTGQTAVETALQNFNGGASSSDSLITVDGFGRAAFAQRKQGPTAQNYDTVETDYNGLGQAYRFTMPYSTTASPSSSNTTVAATTRTYDALGRVLTVTDANLGQASYTYTNNDVLQQVSGSQAFQKQLEVDGLGRLISVCEISSTLPGKGACGQNVSQTGYLTLYTYDALGRVLTVTQNAQATSHQQTRTFTYDMLGRMTSESNPETGNNGSNGTTTYTYDSTTVGTCGSSYPGDLVLTAKPDGSWICYIHDALHRLTDVGNSNQTTTNACKRFRYDSSSNGYVPKPTGAILTNTAGRLIEVETDAGGMITDEWFSYSPRGELTDVFETTPHSGSGVYYHTTASYWPTGALASLSGIPSVPTIYYGASDGSGLDSEGRLTKVKAASGTDPVTGVSYSPGTSTAPLGALTGVTFGSTVSGNDSDGFTYDPNTGRMATYAFSVNSKTDTGTLTWNTNGTLQKLVINDQIPGTSDSQTCNYLYDDLRRLSSANCGALWTQNFTYDVFGNITKTGNSSFIPGYSPTQNQFTSITGVSVSYDKNGNLLTDNLNTYTWDVYGQMSTVSTGSTTVTATYDAQGRMVENNAGGTYTEFVYGPTGTKLAKVNGTTLIKAFIALPGGAKAIYNTSGLAYYRHSDWLGSSRLTSTVSRTVYSSSAYGPFGEQYSPSGTADASFTGKDQDTVGSLYDFPARRQSPSQGRWISPDPAGRAAASLINPQSWNRYAYVNNNPLALVDPFGLFYSTGPCMNESDPNCDGGDPGNFGGDSGLGNPSGAGGCPADPILGIPDCGGGGGGNGGGGGTGSNANNKNGDPCAGQTMNVNSNVTIQSDDQGTVTSTVQLTGPDSYSQDYANGIVTVSPNTSLTIGLQTGGAMSLSLNHPIYLVSTGTGGAYISSATYDISSATSNNAGFTQVNGAVSFAGIPMGSWNTPSDYLLNKFNQNSSLDNAAAILQNAMQLLQTLNDLQRVIAGCKSQSVT